MIGTDEDSCSDGGASAFGGASPEYGLLLALLAVDPKAEAIETQVECVRDWPLFLTLCQRHRVMALVAGRLSKVAGLPDDVAAVVRSELQQWLTVNLQQVAEAQRVVALLEQEGIPCVVLKGAPLSMQAFGDLMARSSRDVDLLVEPAALSAAVAVLEATGMTQTKAKMRWKWGQAVFRRYSHECVLRAPSNMIFELKGRLHPTASLMRRSVSDLLSGRVSVPCAGASLPALAREEMLPYICCHGARHSWFRLKWLVDAAALASQYSADELLEHVDAAHRSGDEVSLLEALELAHDWFGAAIPDAIIRQAKAHPLVRRRRPMITAALFEQDVHLLRKPPIGHPMEASEYLLRRDLSYRRAVFERHVMVRLHSLVKDTWLKRALSRAVPMAGRS